MDDGSAAAVAMTDTQANNQAYNYNWYQVGFLPPAIDAFLSTCEHKPHINNYL